MASDQQTPLPQGPVPPNPNPTAPPTAPADPTPPPTSAARKLPIKRRSPRPTSSSPPSSGSDHHQQPQQQQQDEQPAFKFQRIWTESDELRFLQGLLGCGAQGLVFPRDLNVFYDRFSESMPQPYTRSQLSEKLRRLKNKYRGMSARVAKGLDPARLAPHDRDVLHLCSRLWDPANAATSPFASPGGAGSSGNKRRRANPQGGAALPLPAVSGESNSHDYNGISLPDGSNGEDMFFLEQESGQLGDHEGAPPLVPDGTFGGIVLEQPQTVADVPIGNNGIAGEMNGDHKLVVPSSSDHLMANAVLDVFEECLREAKMNEIFNGGNVVESELAKRWRAQRVDELDVLSRRLRLLVEDAAAAGR